MHQFRVKGRYLSLGFLWIFFWTLGWAQRNPYQVDNFPPSAYASAAVFSLSNSNWDIIQDESGVMYIGNNTCILSFDGREWRSIRGSRNLERAQFTQVDSGYIYWGSNRDLGYLSSNFLGETEIISLKDSLPKSHRDSLDIRWVTHAGKEVLFFSKSYLYRWDSQSNTFSLHQAPAPIEAVFVKGSHIYIWVEETGLHLLQGNEFESQGIGRSGIEVKNLIALDKNSGNRLSLLVITEQQGLFWVENGKWVRRQNELDRHFPQKKIYHALDLHDGNVALATHDHGVILIDTAGNLLQVIDKTSGLYLNTVIRLYQDQAGSLWAAMDAGISRIDYPFHLQHWGPSEQLDGTVYAIYKTNTHLYVGTTAGLYSARQDSSWMGNFTFQKLPIASEVWDIKPYGNHILLATTEGVSILENGQITHITPKGMALARSLLVSRRYPRVVYIGLDNGLAGLVYEKGTWKYQGSNSRNYPCGLPHGRGRNQPLGYRQPRNSSDFWE